MFQNRKAAGELLAQKLIQYRDTNAIVYALPRGGVVLGFEVARFLHLPLDLIIARKIGHPDNSEYAICAITEEGELFCNEREKAEVEELWLDREVKKEQKEVKRRREKYLEGQKRISAKNKIAIIVDDGVATGLTLFSALKSIRREEPKELVVAVPVAPRDVVETLRSLADTVVVLMDEQRYLGAVGAYYQNFPQVSDEEVIELLKQSVLD